MFSCYNCSSSIDDDARTTALQAVGDCTISADCLTAYNEYFGGWATAVGGEIVVGDLTDKTKANFNTQYIPRANTAAYASISWAGGNVSVGYKTSVPWSFDAPSTIVVNQTLKDFTVTEDRVGIKSQIPGTYFLTYSIVLENGSASYPQNVAISGFTPSRSELYAPCLVEPTGGQVTLTGSCIGYLTQDAIITLSNISIPTCTVFSVSISIRFIAPPS